MRSIPRGVAFSGILVLAATAAAQEPPIQPDVRARIEEAVRAADLAARADGSTLVLENAGHGVRARFDATGADGGAVRIEPLFERGWSASLRVTAIGRRDALATPAAPAVKADGATVELDRGGIVEWYENGAQGIEQGFRIARRPEGDGDLRIELAFEGDLRPRLGTDGVELLRRGRTAFRFDSLAASDAAGAAVPARFEAHGDRIRIALDDAKAVYPLTIDPILADANVEIEGNFTGAAFGIALANAGDVNGDGFSDLIAGALNFNGGAAFEGKAYVFHGSASGIDATPDWSVSGGQANAYFARAVSSAGDVNGDGFSDVLVSAQLFDVDQANEGRVFLYLGSGSGLGLAASWTADGNQTDGNLGTALATAGDVNGDGYSDILVGAQVFDTTAVDAGSVFVYYGSASGPPLTPSLVLDGDQANGRFGVAVAGAGDVDGDGFADALIGAQLYTNTKPTEGKAFLFKGSGAGLSTAPDWSAVGDQLGANFGASVNTAGDVDADGFSDILVGAPLFDFGEVDEGRAFLYRGGLLGPSLGSSWSSEGDQNNARHGNNVAPAGDVDGDGFGDVWVSALLYDDSLSDQGRGALYLGSVTGLGSQPFEEVFGRQVSENLGWSLGFVGDVNGDGLGDVAIGSQNYSFPEVSEGRVLVFTGAITGLPSSFQWAAKGGQQGAQFGTEVTWIGDANGDGFSDAAMGAPGYDKDHLEEGRVVAHYGSALGLTPLLGWSVEGGQNGARLGADLAAIGDVNGDGYDDLAVSALGTDSTEPDVGEVRIYFGSATGLPLTPSQRFLGDQSGGLFGHGLGGAGDVDGDGFTDVLIGSALRDGVVADSGRFTLHLGGASGVAETPAFSREGLASGELYGAVVAGLGDVDQDGFADVGVGAPFAASELGRIEVFLGSALGLPASPDASLTGPGPEVHYGDAIAAAGDVNGDGFSDVAVGSEGTVRIYHGSIAGFPGAQSGSVGGGAPNAKFGSVLGTAGDFDLDGFTDLLIGAPSDANGQPAEGRVYLFRGGASGVQTPAFFTAENDQANANFGASVSGSGDTEGDGIPDLLIGVPFGANGFTNEGRAFVYYGNFEAAAGQQFRLTRADSTAPIAFRGRSTAASFLTHALAKTPAGRSRVRLQAEIKAVGVPFDGSSLLTSGIVDTLVEGSDTSISSGVLADGLYHVRARLKNEHVAVPYQPAGRWLTFTGNGPEEADVRVLVDASELVVAPIQPIVIEHVVGTADPADVVLSIKNLGSGPLGFTVSESPPATWFSFNPPTGSNLLAGATQTVTLSFDVDALSPGDYSTSVTITNADDGTDLVTIPVSLTVANPSFEPGDRLEGNFDAAADVIDASFAAVAGMTLKVTLQKTAAPIDATIQVLDDALQVVKGVTVKFKPSETTKLKFKIAASGNYTLRFIAGPNDTGAFAVKTGAVLPAKAKDIVETLTLKNQVEKSLPFLVLPGAILKITADPKNAFTGPLTLFADTPEGGLLDLGTMGVAQPDGGIVVNGLLLDEVGEYVLKVASGATAKETVKVTIHPDQPIGDSTIVLP